MCLARPVRFHGIRGFGFGVWVGKGSLGVQDVVMQCLAV